MDIGASMPRVTNRLAEEMEEADFREFVESISVTSEVMAILHSMPEIASIEQTKQYLKETKGTSREASTGLRSRRGLRSVATRYWRHVVGLLSLHVFGKPHIRYHGVN
jgi:hypothetical protein